MIIQQNTIRFFFILFLTVASAKANILTSKPSGPINDFAGVLSSEASNALIALCNNVNKKTGVALVLATFSSLEGEEIDDITNKLYEKWGIGQKGRDEGVLVFLAMKERKIRIETGYGSEGYVTDLLASRIRQQATAEYLSKNRWDEGITSIFHSLTQLVAKEKGVPFQELVSKDQYIPLTRTTRHQRSTNPLLFLFIFIIIIFLLGTRTGRSMLPWILLFSLGGRRSGFGGGGFGGGFGGGGFGGFGGGMRGGGGSSGSF